MGVVYRGYDPVIERLVAIKTVRKEMVEADPAARLVERFQNEAKAGGRLVHPNIVGVYEYGEDESNAYIVMEYVEGTGLRDFMSRQVKFDLGQIRSIMTQLLDALEFAHQRRVIHRDIKPTNLILTSGGRLKLADFGIAHLESSDLTTAGTVLGTPSYMSPEQIQGRPIDGRSDLFSAGVVLYELLTGETPFVGSLTTIAYKICHEDPVPPSRSGRALPPLADEVVGRALAKDPEARYQSAREFREAVDGAFRPASAMPAASETIGGRAPASATGALTEALGPPAAGGAPPAAASGASGGSTTSAAQPFEQAFVDQAAARLAVYLGPISGWVTKRAVRQAGSREELIRILAGHLGAQERRAFLRDVGFPES